MSESEQGGADDDKTRPIASLLKKNFAGTHGGDFNLLTVVSIGLECVNVESKFDPTEKSGSRVGVIDQVWC